MEQPLWRFALAYVQAEPLRPAPLGASAEYDAIACYMVRDEMFAEMGEADGAGAQLMAADELETFSAPIPTTSLWVEEERIVDGELGGITAFLFFADAERGREVAVGAGGLHRVVLNRRQECGPLGGAMNTLPYQAVVELSAVDLPGLAAAVGPDGKLLSEAEVAVVTREVVLWDRLPRRDA